MAWFCKCDCGQMCKTTAKRLKNGMTKSCGCLKNEARIRNGKANETHGMKKTPEYRSWRGMKNRCFNKKYSHYQDYGARGITVFPEWIDSFEKFFAYMGLKPSPELTIERLNVNGNYEPGNVKWGTIEEQNNNRRDNRLLTAFGETMTISRWTKKMGLPRTRVYARLKLGWSIEAALTTPLLR